MEHKKLLETWIEKYTQRLVRLAYTYLYDWSSSEDRVQDAFIKAYHSMKQLLNNDDPFPWLAQIVINECRLSNRKTWREVIMSILPERRTVSTEETYLREEQLQQLHEKVLTLPERFSVPIILFYFDELSVEQIAKILRISTGTVKSRLSRGRERLRKKFLEDDYQHGRGTQSCEIPLHTHR